VAIFSSSRTFVDVIADRSVAEVATVASAVEASECVSTRCIHIAVATSNATLIDVDTAMSAVECWCYDHISTDHEDRVSFADSSSEAIFANTGEGAR